MGIPVVIQSPYYTPAATPCTIVLTAPIRAFIMRFRVVQKGGAGDGFTATLYEAAAAAGLTKPPAKGFNGPLPSGTLGADAELYRVGTPLVVASGLSGEQLAAWNYYENKDGGPTNRQRFLYMHLVVNTGLASKTFAVSLAVDEPTNL